MTTSHNASENAPADGAVNPDLLAQLANTLWLPQDLDEAARAARMAAARALLEDINPAAGIEGMLACQMVATHEAAMACLSRSMVAEASPEQTDQNLKHAERLMALYTRQVEVLGRHRSRDHQLRERLEQQRRKEEREAWLESVAGPPELAFETLLAFAQENNTDWDEADDDDAYADADAYLDATLDGDGANGAGVNDQGTSGAGVDNLGANGQEAYRQGRDPALGDR